MNFVKAIVITLLLFFIHPCVSVFAQIADTSKFSADTTHLIKDSAAIPHSHEVSDSLKIRPDSTLGDSLAAMLIDTPKQATHAVSKGYVINGKAEDANTGEGIPFATVFFPHTPAGTAADLNGNFVIKTRTLPNDTLRIQAMGYDSYDKILDKRIHDYNLIAELNRATHSLNEVVIHAGEDPAIALLKKIIAKKPDNNPDKTENYKYQAYNKLEVDLQRLTKSQFEKIPGLRNYAFIYNNLDTVSEDRPFLPIYLTETMSDYYFQRKPRKQREFIKASMVRGFKNQSITRFLGTAYQDVNVYDNFIPVFDKQFVSPISNSGLFYYKYTIKDTEQAYGHNIILVQFKPRRNGENCFYGDFWVVDSVFALQRVSMEVPKIANVNWVNRISLYEEFAPVNDSIWFCVKDKFIADFDAPYGVKIPGLIGRKTTTYQNIVANDTSIANVLDDKKYKEDVIVSDSARLKTDAWWARSRPDSLSKNEKTVYHMIDTINSMPITALYKKLVKLVVTGKIDKGPFEFGPIYNVFSQNPYEGDRFRFSMGTTNKLFDNIHLTGYLAYGTLDQKFKYGLTGLWLLNRKPRMYLYASDIHDVNYGNNYYDQVSADNIFSVLFRKPGVPWKLAFADEKRLEFYKEYFSGFSHQLAIDHRTFSVYHPLPDSGIFFDNNGRPSDNVVSTEAELTLRFAYKEKYLEGNYLRISLGSQYPIVQLKVNAGVKDVWNSGYNYQKVRLTISDYIKIPPLGSIYYNVFSGKYFGTLPYPLLEIHPGNEYLYYNPHAFEMMNKYEFLSDEYAGVIFEHNIGGGIFNYIPAVKKLKLRQFWTAKAVIGSLSPENQKLNLTSQYPFRTLQGNPYVELGTGISNIFEVFRIDFVWRVTPQPLPGESKSKYFGIFGSVHFTF